MDLPSSHRVLAIHTSYHHMGIPSAHRSCKVYNILLPHGHTHSPSCMYGMHSFYYHIGVPSVQLEQPDLSRPHADSGMIGYSTVHSHMVYFTQRNIFTLYFTAIFWTKMIKILWWAISSRPLLLCGKLILSFLAFLDDLLLR